MRNWFFVVLVMVAAAGNVVRAEPAAPIPGRVGVDGVVGIGLFELIGGSVRAEQPIAGSLALIARAGHLQIRWIENETKELYPVYFGHLGLRYYGGALYGALEAGAVLGSDYRGWHAAPSGAVTLGGKLSRVDLGLSLIKLADGLSLGAHLGFDFATW
jgi:hypothetical protein